MKNQFDYSKYKCPYSHIEKECGHELHGPEGYDGNSVWCPCGYRGPVFCLDPEVLGLEKVDEDEERHGGDVNSYYETIMSILEKQSPVNYYRCGTCGGPVASGLCCAWCNSTDPETTSCLTCEFEPEWDTGYGNKEYGLCEWEPDNRPHGVACIEIAEISKSKPHTNCPAWRPKL